MYVYIYIYILYIYICTQLYACIRSIPPVFRRSGPVAGSFATRFVTHLGHWAAKEWRIWATGEATSCHQGLDIQNWQQAVVFWCERGECWAVGSCCPGSRIQGTDVLLVRWSIEYLPIEQPKIVLQTACLNTALAVKSSRCRGLRHALSPSWHMADDPVQRPTSRLTSYFKNMD